MTFKPQISVLLFVFCIGLVGCNASKTVLENGALNPKITTKQVVNNSNKSTSNFSTLSGRFKIEMLNGSSSQTVSVSVRMEKDKTIWMSKLGIVKALITPERVAFYNKLDGTYFDGDFSYLSDLLGTELDFNKVQALLLGEPIYKPNTKDYEVSVFGNSYMLQPKNQLELFELFLLFNPTHFKMDSQQISQAKEQRLLQIDYKTYQNVDDEIIPEIINIIAVEKEDQSKINIELKSIELNETLRFPFTIPSGYKEVEIK